MNEVKSLLAPLTQQVIPRSEEGNASRASSSRTHERMDTGRPHFSDDCLLNHFCSFSRRLLFCSILVQ